MTKVYVVLFFGEIDLVFKTREQAEKYVSDCDNYDRHCFDIEEWNVQ